MFLVNRTVNGAFTAAFLVVVKSMYKVLFMSYAVKDMADYLFERLVSRVVLFHFLSLIHI